MYASKESNGGGGGCASFFLFLLLLLTDLVSIYMQDPRLVLVVFVNFCGAGFSTTTSSSP